MINLRVLQEASGMILGRAARCKARANAFFRKLFRRCGVHTSILLLLFICSAAAVYMAYKESALMRLYTNTSHFDSAPKVKNNPEKVVQSVVHKSNQFIFADNQTVETKVIKNLPKFRKQDESTLAAARTANATGDSEQMIKTPNSNQEGSNSSPRSPISRFPSDGFVPVFQPSSLSQILIYSVWYDPRVPYEVRVVALAKMANLSTIDQLRCVYYRLEKSTSTPYTDATKMNFSSFTSVEKPLTTLNITTGRYHRGFLTINCATIENITVHDWWLSIVPTNKTSYSPNFKPVIKMQIPKHRERFGLCIQPLFGNVKKVDVIQMIEFNRILGARYFYFYNHSLSVEAQQVLRYYTMQTDHVEVLPWQFDASSLDVRNVGQKGALADCQRRLAQNFEYLVYTDLDEFIVLNTHKSWHAFSDLYMALYPASQYVFNHIYFVQNEKQSNKQDDNVLRLSSLDSTKRFLEHLPNWGRVKVIAVAECVSLHYIHFVVEFMQTEACRNLTSHEVDSRVGFLHHYRYATANIPDNKRLIEDQYVVNTYKDDLLYNVRLVLLELEKISALKSNNAP